MRATASSRWTRTGASPTAPWPNCSAPRRWPATCSCAPSACAARRSDRCAALSLATRSAIAAYTRGVNAWLAANPLPPEYGALELTRADPWTDTDSVVVAKLIAFSLSFDLDTDASNSVAATIYAVWRSRAIANTIDAALRPSGLPLPGSQEVVNALRHLLDTFEARGGVGASGINFFNVPGVVNAADRRDVVLLRSLREALTLLASDEFKPAFANSTQQLDYRWGKLHRIVLAHPLFPAPLAGLTGIPTDGGFSTVDASSHARAATLSGFMFAARRVAAPGTLRLAFVSCGGASARGARCWPRSTRSASR